MSVFKKHKYNKVNLKNACVFIKDLQAEFEMKVEQYSEAYFRIILD